MDNGTKILTGCLAGHSYLSSSGKRRYGYRTFLSERIVRAYNGEIRASNDNGACFEFLLRDLEVGSQKADGVNLRLEVKPRAVIGTLLFSDKRLLNYSSCFENRR